MQAVHGRSFFHWQLGLRGLFLNQGPHKEIVRNIRVSDFMEPLQEGEVFASTEEGDAQIFLTEFDTLETALRAFDDSGMAQITVVDDTDTTRVIGWARQLAATDAFNRALIEANVEKHG
jgi:chloride channel protein, CIC family